MDNLLLLLFGIAIGTHQAENIRKVVPVLTPKEVS